MAATLNERRVFAALLVFGIDAQAVYPGLPLKIWEYVMAKSATVKVKLLSTADTGFFYVTKKNPRNLTEKMSFRKYDPVVRKHVEFKEAKIK